MRKAALLGVCVMMSGCAGFEKVMSDTMSLPGENPNAPSGSDLNMRRVQGQATSEVPILPQGGNVWPGPPDPLPTLEDVAKGRTGKLPGEEVTAATGPQLPDGQEMSIGEKENIHKGVVGNSLYASPVAGATTAQPAGAAKAKAAPIEIPNGDGTTTLIHSDGSISTIGTPRRGAMPAH
ncbi:hypothetical protein [Acetobacter ghanensis]|uniref:Lipoprotein n=2 Tax=Acetobacter ghanensis TaxID=431306 RepID=A0A0U5FY43_9PROT|nr:hypothetical protein [Acetobacter ghanensis]NHO38308.1 hypothetical protein [Acetobacter ghanensis]CEF55690.1 hypothetical protein AGA_1562 [Acetobacter ghanensis]